MSIKIYWNTAMFICLGNVCAFFCAKMPALNSCNRDTMTYKVPKYLLSGLLQKIYAKMDQVSKNVRNLNRQLESIKKVQ